MALYDKFTSIKNPGRKVQVESAIRDGIGRIIANELDSRLELITEDILVKDAPNVFVYNDKYFCYKTIMFNNRVGMTMIDSHGYYYLSGLIKNKYLSEILVEENYNQFVRTVEVDSTPLEIQNGTVNIDLSGKVDKSNAENILYGTDGSGQQVVLEYDYDLNPDYIPIRDSQAQLYVPLLPTGNYHATSKKYVDDLVQAVKKNSFTEVDITTYPTLNDFLASTGEEGYMYLYPIDTSDLSKGYHQYIWENNTWIYMGDTQLNLTNYPRKDQNETITAQWTFSNGLYTTDSSIVDSQNGLSTQYRYKGSAVFYISSSSMQIAKPLYPIGNNLDIGYSQGSIRDIYINRNITDNTNSYTIAESMAQFNPSVVGTTVIKWSQFCSFSLSADTTLTLETTKTDCLCEYKALITNSGASAIVLTFTGVTNILCNDDNITISTNTLTLPSGVSIEVSIVNNKMVAINFEAQ